MDSTDLTPRTGTVPVRGFIGNTTVPGTGETQWWGACGFIHGVSLPDVLKNLAQASEDPTQNLEEMAAVEAALQETDGE